MKVSTKGRYGLRILLELALRAGQGPVQAGELAQAQGIPGKYLHVLLGSLKAAGLVQAQRGPTGGFTLAREATRITVLDVVEAMEGPVVLAQGEPWVLQQCWDALAVAHRSRLQEQTLAGLAEEAARLQGRADGWSI